MNNEMNRIQAEYRKIFVKLQNQLTYYINLRLEDEKKGKREQPQSSKQPDVSYI